jgi:hypothetical protein
MAYSQKCDVQVHQLNNHLEKVGKHTAKPNQNPTKSKNKIKRERRRRIGGRGDRRIGEREVEERTCWYILPSTSMLTALVHSSKIAYWGL